MLLYRATPRLAHILTVLCCVISTVCASSRCYSCYDGDEAGKLVEIWNNDTAYVRPHGGLRKPARSSHCMEINENTPTVNCDSGIYNEPNLHPGGKTWNCMTARRGGNIIRMCVEDICTIKADLDARIAYLDINLFPDIDRCHPACDDAMFCCDSKKQSLCNENGTETSPLDEDYREEQIQIAEKRFTELFAESTPGEKFRNFAVPIGVIAAVFGVIVLIVFLRNRQSKIINWNPGYTRMDDDVTLVDDVRTIHDVTQPIPGCSGVV